MLRVEVVWRTIYMSGFSFRDPPLDSCQTLRRSFTCKHHQPNVPRSQLNPKPFIRPSRCRVRNGIYRCCCLVLRSWMEVILRRFPVGLQKRSSLLEWSTDRVETGFPQFYSQRPARSISGSTIIHINAFEKMWSQEISHISNPIQYHHSSDTHCKKAGDE